MKATHTAKKVLPVRRGRPPTGTSHLIGVRLQPDILAELDAWMDRAWPKPLSRSAACRELVVFALGARRVTD